MSNEESPSLFNESFLETVIEKSYTDSDSEETQPLEPDVDTAINRYSDVQFSLNSKD